MKIIARKITKSLSVSCFIMLGGLCVLPTQLQAAVKSGESTSKILLIVNKHPITERDLQQRIKLMTLSSGGNNAELGDSQKGEILESLIHESLQIQEAQKKKIIIKDAEVMATIGEMGKENGMTAEKLLEFFKSNGIDKDTLYNRVKAQLHWNRYVRQQFSPLVYVSDAEAEAQFKKMDSEKGNKEYLVSEIVLSVSDPKQEAQTEKDAQNLVRDIRKGAKFEAIAQNVSKGSSALKGGDLGWMSLSGLESSLAEKLGHMRIGQVSDPIKVSGGYKIIQLKDIRHSGKPTQDDMQVTMVQAVLPVSPQPSEEEVNYFGPIIDELTEVNGCKGFLSKAKSHNINANENKGIRLGQLPEPLKEMIRTTSLGKTLQPIMTPDGLIVTMVCERKEAKPVVITKEDISSNLEQQKYGSRAERELQRLKASAYYEIKDESVRKLIKL